MFLKILSPKDDKNGKNLLYGIVFDISNITHRLPRSEKNVNFALGYAKLYFVHVLYSKKKGTDVSIFTLFFHVIRNMNKL